MSTIFRTKKALILALLDGRKFKVEGENYDILSFDKNNLLEGNPFRFREDELKGKDWDFSINTVLFEIKHWYEEIPQKGVLCWVTDIEEDRKVKKFVTLIIKYTLTDSGRSEFKSKCSNWVYATPISVEDVYKGK